MRTSGLRFIVVNFQEAENFNRLRRSQAKFRPELALGIPQIEGLKSLLSIVGDQTVYLRVKRTYTTWKNCESTVITRNWFAKMDPAAKTTTGTNVLP
jgi:hypothetical protein